MGCQDKEHVFPSKSSTKSSAAARKAVAPKDSLANPLADGATTNNTRFVPVKPDGKGTYSEPWEVDGGLVTIVGLVPADKLVQMLPGLFRVTVPGFYSTYFFRAGFYCDRKMPATPVTVTGGNGSNANPYQLAEFVVHGNVPRTHYTDYGGGFYYFQAETYANPNLIPGAGSPTTSAYPAGYYKIKTVIDPSTKVIDNLANPCLKGVLKDIQAKGLKFEVTDILQKVFGIGDKVDLTFRENNTLPITTDGQISGSGVQLIYSGGKVYGNITIELNPVALANATKEYIAVTILHECIHAYITYRNRFVAANGHPEAVINKLFDHDVMAVSYIDALSKAICGAYPSYPYEYAQAISWGGLETTASWSVKPAVIKNLILDKNKAEKGISGTQVGTKCP